MQMHRTMLSQPVPRWAGQVDAERCFLAKANLLFSARIEPCCEAQLMPRQRLGLEGCRDEQLTVGSVLANYD